MTAQESLAYADPLPNNFEEEIVTVDNIRNEFIEKFGSNASTWTKAQRNFSKKLNKLGNQAMAGMTPAEIDATENIDTLIELSAEETKSLREEMETL